MAPENRRVAAAALGLAAVTIVYLAGGLDGLPWDLRPGSAIGQSLGILAGVLLLATLAYVRVRRSEAPHPAKPAAQLAHALVGTLGTALAIMHSRAALSEWSTLVLFAVLGLVASGLYGRVVAPRRVGTTFGRGAVPYQAAHQGATAEGDRIVEQKRRLIRTFTEHGREGEFVLRWQHWRRNPRGALRYHRLGMLERRVMAANPLSASTEISLLERWWRRAHLILAALFVIGLFAHVVTTVFFAGYVAEGRDIYWWHLTDW